MIGKTRPLARPPVLSENDIYILCCANPWSQVHLYTAYLEAKLTYFTEVVFSRETLYYRSNRATWKLNLVTFLSVILSSYEGGTKNLHFTQQLSAE